MAQEQSTISSLAVFRLLLPLYLGVVLSPLNISGTINMLPTLSEDFGISLSLAGLAVTLYVLPLVISQIGSGVIAEILGPSRTLMLGLLIFSIACLVAAVVPSYPTFLAARAVQGLGVGFTLPVSMGMAGEQVPPDRTSTAIGGIQAAFYIGMAIGPGAGGLFAEHLQWRGFYIFLAGAGIIAASTVAIAYSGRRRPVGGRNPLLLLKQAMAVHAVRMASLAGFLTIFALISVLIFVAIWLQRTGLTGPASSGLLLAIPGFAGIFVAPLAGLLGDKWGNRRVVMAGIAVFVAGLLGLIALPGVLGAYPPLLLLVGIGSAGMMTNVGAMALSLRPDLRQAISGVFNGSRFFGVVLAPLILMPVYEAVSIRGVLLVIIVASIILGAVLRQVERGAELGSKGTGQTKSPAG